jgi:hypothetical protein
VSSSSRSAKGEIVCSICAYDGLWWMDGTLFYLTRSVLALHDGHDSMTVVLILLIQRQGGG